MSASEGRDPSQGLASVTFKSDFSSNQFTFVVSDGEKQAKFTIHSAIVAKQSPKFNALMNNGMKESKEQSVFFTEDPGTFQRFADFVYTGPNDVDERQERNPDTGATAREKTRLGPNTTFSLNYRAPHQAQSKRKYDMLWHKFLSICPTAPNNPKYKYSGPGYDYTDILLAHAKVYVFADYHGVKELQSLSLHRICRGLAYLALDKWTVQDFVELARYCFANTVDKEGSKDPLREAVIIYASCKLDLAWGVEAFRDLVANNSEFSVALVERVQERLD